MWKKLLLILLALSAGRAVRGQTIAPPYSSSYTLVTLGNLPAVPSPYGGLTFLNPSTLLLGGDSEGTNGAIYSIPVIRNSSGHITGFGTPKLYASAPDIDGGLAFGPGGVLFATAYPANNLLEFKPGSTSPDLTIALGPFGVTSSVGTLQFVPPGMPGTSDFKIVSYNSVVWNNGTLAPNSNGTYDLTAVTPTVNSQFTSTEGITYVPLGSAQFNSPSVLVSVFGQSAVFAYTLDSDGNPTGTGSEFMSLPNAMGATYDPLTGDALFSTFYGAEVYEVQGFKGGKVTATSGGSQSAVVGKAFANPLKVTVKDPFGKPLGGVTVTFTAPSSGASAVLSSRSKVTASNGTATITATANATAGSYSVTAKVDGASVSFPLTNVALSALTLSPTSVVGGLSTTANTVTITSAAPASGATITLSSSNPAVAAAPASVTVAAGATVSAPFTITTTSVASAKQVTITASDGTNTKTGRLTVKPALLSAVNLSPTTMVGGKSTTANTVTLNGPAPSSGAVVALTSSDPTIATPPVSVTVPAGATTSPAFTITTKAVTTATPVTIFGNYNGASKSAVLTVNPPALASLKLGATSMKGGSTTRVTVTLSGPAPAGGAIVMLTSNNAVVASPPTTVTVAAGATSSAFTITTTAVTANTGVSITATYGGATKAVNLAVTP
jgi:hypothetical protein